ncbi:unnamed protein product [Bursaphelenchus xylophilus]|uniref:(pine wood nematode) hypothetical protein n=1 Tax=Bursaphelenchus xylophilus TaxID=6326 RepID=A0A1I7SCZ0_BURXY|nr:unnamed protein product [Bursaphelenchus xylophilus]CAG9093219.1 unnamed protein product [Bursaphelenchus xylophilus]
MLFLLFFSVPIVVGQGEEKEYVVINPAPNVSRVSLINSSEREVQMSDKGVAFSWLEDEYPALAFEHTYWNENQEKIAGLLDEMFTALEYVSPAERLGKCVDRTGLLIKYVGFCFLSRESFGILAKTTTVFGHFDYVRVCGENNMSTLFALEKENGVYNVYTEMCFVTNRTYNGYNEQNWPTSNGLKCAAGNMTFNISEVIYKNGIYTTREDTFYQTTTDNECYLKVEYIDNLNAVYLEFGTVTDVEENLKIFEICPFYTLEDVDLPKKKSIVYIERCNNDDYCNIDLSRKAMKTFSFCAAGSSNGIHCHVLYDVHRKNLLRSDVSLNTSGLNLDGITEIVGKYTLDACSQDYRKIEGPFYAFTVQCEGRECDRELVKSVEEKFEKRSKLMCMRTKEGISVNEADKFSNMTRFFVFANEGQVCTLQRINNTIVADVKNKTKSGQSPCPTVSGNSYCPQICYKPASFADLSDVVSAEVLRLLKCAPRDPDPIIAMNYLLRKRYCLSNTPTITEVEIIPDGDPDDNTWTTCDDKCFAMHEAKRDNWMFGCASDYEFVKHLCSTDSADFPKCFYVPEHKDTIRGTARSVAAIRCRKRTALTVARRR